MGDQKVFLKLDGIPQRAFDSLDAAKKAAESADVNTLMELEVYIEKYPHEITNYRFDREVGAWVRMG